MKLLIIFISLLLSTSTKCSRILGIFPMAAHSHHQLGFKLMKGLVERGHEVTFLSPFPSKTPMKNLKDISVAEIIPQIMKKKKELYDMGKYSILGQVKWVTDLGVSFTETVFNTKSFQELLNSQEEFDLVIMEDFVNQAFLGLGYRFKCPLIVLSPVPLSFLNGHYFSNPSPASYVPNLLSNLKNPMSLWERMKNLFYDVSAELYLNQIVYAKQEAIMKKAIPNVPDIKDLMANISALFLLSHPSMNEPVPLAPGIVEIAGYHVDPPKALDKGLQEYLDNASEGVIVFSMGSNLKSADFPKAKQQAILEAFRGVKQKVLWKFEKDLPEKPDNIKILNWLPQNDVLAHKNVKLLITHGGLLGTIEAVYHGVPVLVLPVYWDQLQNAMNAAEKNYGLYIPYHEVNEENFPKALNEMLSNPKYRDNVQQRSKALRDNPLNQMDTAIFWIEYVIRHQGAAHLKNAGLQLSWLQRNMIDIIVILTIITIILFLIFYYIFKHIINLLKSKKASEKKQKIQ